MITRIKTKGFKGQDINEDVYPKTIYCGPNTSGKSTRAAALALAILGFIPFAAKTNKKASDIINDFGAGDTLTVAVVCNEVEFERHFYRKEDGGVSQRLRVDKKKYSASDYAVAMSNAGCPRIVDVNDFISMSDQKKMDMLFDLFPPKANLKDLDSQIEKAKKTVTDLQAKDRASIAVVQRLTKSKGEIELPAGTLAEVQAEIETLTGQVKTLQEEIKQAEIADAQEKVKEQAKADAVKSVEASNHVEKPEIQTDNSPGIVDFVQGRQPSSYPHFMKVYDEGNDPAVSIQKILDALNKSGCSICAAAIIAKHELKKFKKGAAA